MQGGAFESAEGGEVGTYEIGDVGVAILVELEPFFFGGVPEDVAHGFGDGRFAGGGRARGSGSAAGGEGAAAGHGGCESGEKSGEVGWCNFGCVYEWCGNCSVGIVVRVCAFFVCL